MKRAAALLAALLALLPAAALAKISEPVAIVVHVRAGHLIDPASGRVSDDQQLTIINGRIAAIAPWTPPAGRDRIVDWSQRWVLPGLIDMHTHVGDGFPGDSDPAAALKHGESETAFKAVEAARLTIEAGFTSVRDVGVYRGLTDVALRDAIAKGWVTGPRMWVAGAYITKPGGGGAVTGAPAGTVIPEIFRLGEVRGAADARVKTRYLIEHGADFIKMIATGAVLAIGSVPGELELTPEEMQASCDEARRLGRYCIAHAHGAAGIKAAMRAGARSIEHASLIDDEGIAMARERGVWLDMDVYDGDWINEVGSREGWPAEYLRKNVETTEVQRQAFGKAVKAGVKLSFGTDSGVYPHGLNARQFAYMVRYGMTPLQAIQSATTVAAELLREPGRVGCVAVGCFGDLVAVDRDPLQDVRALERVSGVIKDGAVVK